MLLKILIFFVLTSISIFLLYKKIKIEKEMGLEFKMLFKKSSYFYIKYIFLFISFIILLIGIFDIKSNLKIEKTESNGIDIIFILDVSKSMNALDFKINNNSISRLEFAKNLISSYVNKNIENRYGLVIFAGDAISSCPLTNDKDIFLTFLSRVDYRNLETQGTNIKKAIELGVNRFDISEDDRSKAIIFLSDGGDESFNDSSYVKNIIKDKNIASFIIGIGSKSGSKIPYIDEFSFTQYQKYNGKDVITKLNEKALNQLANSLNGKYIEVSTLEDINTLNDYIQTLEKKVIEYNGNYNQKSLARILAIISAIFFVIYLIFEFLIIGKKY